MEDYAKYLVDTPVYKDNSGTMTLLSPELVPETGCTVEINWISNIGEMPPPVPEQTQPQDRIIILWGANSQYPQVLGGKVHTAVGGQKTVLTTTTGIYVPAGVPHGPFEWRTLFAPHVMMTMTLPSSIHVERKRGIIDFEQYIIRSPMREAGAELTAGRTAPTMTYMSGVQIPGVKVYIEFGWTFGMPESSRAKGAMPAMAHPNFEEVVLHIGGDPDNPEDLGGDLEFYVGGQPLTFNRTSALFIPKNVEHGPIRCLEYRKPHIVMAIMVGAATIQEGWAGSFKEE